ncbi:MAG: UDP-glucose/GDP-mannose dehydrogenase family protein [Gammaproteobacteria bacterium]|nr:MAG: UDP-glucose/GDP-mannose dehydrogenase family protein [Gammaproteobacteria bacterium]
MKVTIYGTGYVGLVTGVCLAEVGNQVLCIDIDEDKLALLRKGHSPIYEPGIEELLEENIRNNRIRFSSDFDEAVTFGEFQFIAVGTPPDEDGSADLKHVLAVAKSIGERVSSYRLVVTKSTVPVGTSDKVRRAIEEEIESRGIQVDFDVASNPEFLKEGAAINDFMKPDRIVVGVDSDLAEALMRNLYAPFNRNHDRMVVMDIRSSEFTKYASNSMLATKISLMNEFSNIAERMGADIEKVRIGMGSDPRIGYHFIYPGCGYGGSCFPKDVKALEFSAKEIGVPADILTAVERVNDRQKRIMFEKIRDYFDSDLEGKTIALWGLSFKPETDDMREAPSRVIMELLWEAGARVSAYDPEASNEARRIYGERDDLRICSSADEALMQADALVVVTEWKVFRSPDFSMIRDRLNVPVIFDGRNIYDPSHVTAAGLDYVSIGRKPVLADG